MTKSIKIVLASLVTSQLKQLTFGALVGEPSPDASLADGSEKVKTEGESEKPVVGVNAQTIGEMIKGNLGAHVTVVSSHSGIHGDLLHHDFGMHGFGHHVHDDFGMHEFGHPYDHYDHYDPYHHHSDVQPGLLTHAAENLEGGWGTFKHVLAHWTRNMGTTMGRLGHGLHRAGQEAHAMSHVGYGHDHYDPYDSYGHDHYDPYDSYGHDSYDHYAHYDPYAQAAYHGGHYAHYDPYAHAAIHSAYSPHVHAASYSPAHASIVYGSAAQAQGQETVQPDMVAGH